MVHVVEVVVEEEQPEERRGLDDDGAAARRLVRLVLGEGAEIQDRQAEIGGRQIEPDGTPQTPHVQVSTATMPRL